MSNIIFALAVGPGGAVWAATEEGVSRIQEAGGEITITNFSSLDGLALPVRDVAVDTAGTAWLATDGGLYRIIPQGGQTRGIVRDVNGNPVVGADIIVLGTPFRAITDAVGHFVLVNLPPGQHRLQIEGSLALGGPLRSSFRDVVVTVEGVSDLEDINTTPKNDLDNLRLIGVSGNRQSGKPGEVLPEPLVVRLQDQFGNPVEGQEVTAQIIEGQGELVPMPDAEAGEGAVRTEQSDAQGEVRFFLRIGDDEADRVETRVTATPTPDQQVQFLSLVGFSIPISLAVESDGVLVVVDTGLDAVLRVDPSSGTRSLVSGRGRGSGPVFLSPWGIAVASDGFLLVADNFLNAVLRVDPDSGDRTVVSGCVDAECSATVGSGPSFEGPQDIAVLSDGALAVVDNFLNAVLRVDLDSGNRTLVSGCVDIACSATVGSGPAFVSPGALAIEPDGTLVLVDVFLNAVVRILANGNRIIASGCVDITDCTDIVGAGPPFLFPWSIAAQADGSLIVADILREAILHVDPDTGDRILISGCPDSVDCPDTIGSGTLFLSLRDIAVEADGQLVMVDDGLDTVLRVDPVNGDRTIVSRASTGGGSPFGAPVDIAVEDDGQLLVVDALRKAVARVDPGSGSRILVSGCFDTECPATIGSGPAFVSPRTLAVEGSGSIVVTDTSLAAVVRIAPDSGDRTVVSGCLDTECRISIGSGLNFVSPRGLAVDNDGSLLVADNFLNAVLRIAPGSGDRTVVSGQGRGSGPPLTILTNIAVEFDGSLVVVDGGLNAVVRIAPDSGDRTVVSGQGRGSGPNFIFPEDLAVGSDGFLMVVDSALDAVLQVDPGSGDRIVVSDVGTGSGLSFVSPFGIAIESDGRLAVVDALLAAVVRVNPVTGDRATVSRVSLIPAAAFAKVPSGSVTARPIEDFVDAQGTFCIPDGMGGCFLLVPPIENFVGFFAAGRVSVVDYAGLSNDAVEEESGGNISFGTELDGFVIERPLADGRAHVTVLLSTKNALTWIFSGGDFVTSPLLFGHRVSDVLDEGKEPALGTSSMLLVFINTAPGADLPDFVELVFFPQKGQEWSYISLRSQTDGPLREAFGVPDGTPGRATVKQLSIFIPPFFEGFPVEGIDLQILGE
jgi:streptogramin lyase